MNGVTNRDTLKSKRKDKALLCILSHTIHNFAANKINLKINYCSFLPVTLQTR